MKLVILLILTINLVFSAKIKSRVKHKTGASTNSKHLLKNHKDGPITWDMLTNAKSFSNLMQQEQKNNNYQITSSQNTVNNKIINNNNTNTYTGLINNTNTAVAPVAAAPNTKPAPISPGTLMNNLYNTADENQKSKTFRSVGPKEDTTVNRNGQRYSQLYSNNGSNGRKTPGYYGSSRLTR
jgi:hypothetical protein